MQIKPNPNSGLATYTFEEAIEMICHCQSKEDLNLLADVINEEKREYSIFHLKLIYEAFRLMRSVYK